MGRLAAQRARQIARKGRPMTLRRLTAPETLGYAEGDVTGFSSAEPDAEPQDGTAGENRRRRHIELGAIPPDWPAPPRGGDELLDGVVTFSVSAAEPVWDGAELAGWRLWVEGGTA